MENKVIKTRAVVFTLFILLLASTVIAQKKKQKVVEHRYKDFLFTGTLINGKPNGQGKAYYPSANHTYTGEWKDGLRHGQGTYNYGNSEVRTGGWLNNKIHGYAESSQGLTGTVFKGNWENGKRQGKGVKYFANGAVISGIYLNGRREGTFVFDHPDGRKLQALYKDNQVVGDTVVLQKGNPLPFAQKTFIVEAYLEEYRYTGEFLNGKPNGKGEANFYSGNFYLGEWENGKRQGEGFFKYKNRDRYMGTWHQNQQQGQGTYRWSSGTRYVGNWNKGEMEGKGKYTTADGIIRDGFFKDGKKHGTFTIIHPDGKKEVKVFVMNEEVKDETLTSVENPKTPKESVKTDQRAYKMYTKVAYADAMGWLTDLRKNLGKTEKELTPFLQTIGYQSPNQNLEKLNNFTSKSNGYELSWSYGILFKISILKSELRKDDPTSSHFKTYSFNDYRASGIRQNGKITENLYWRSGAEREEHFMTLDFKKNGSLKSKTPIKIILNTRVNPKHLLTAYQSFHPNKYPEGNEWEIFLFQTYKSIPTQYWLKHSEAGFEQENNLSSWIFENKELGMDILYDKGPGKKSNSTRSPRVHDVQALWVTFHYRFKGVLPGGATMKELKPLIANQDIEGLQKYYHSIQHFSYMHNDTIRAEDYVMMAKGGKAIIWLTVKNRGITGFRCSRGTIEGVVKARIDKEKRSIAYTEKQKRDASKAKLALKKRLLAEAIQKGDETIGKPWKGGRYIDDLASESSQMNKLPDGGGTWVKDGIMYKGLFVQGWMDRSFVVSDLNDNEASGNFFNDKPVGKWTSKQNGEIIQYVFDKNGEIIKATMNGKGLFVKGVSDREVIYELYYRAVQKKSDGRILQADPTDYQHQELRTKMGELSFSSLMSDEVRINNNLNYNLLESTLYVEATGACSCNNYYSYNGWELLGCERVKSIPAGANVEDDTCEGYYLPDQYMPFWMR